MSSQAYKFVRAGIAGSMVLIALLGGTALWLTRQFLNANEWVRHTTEVIGEVRTTRQLLGIAAAAQANGAREPNLGALQRQIDDVAELTRDNPWQQRNVSDLRTQIARTAPASSDSTLVFAPGVFENANAILDRMQREEYGLLLDRSRVAANAMRSAGISIFFLCAGLLSLGIVTTLAARKEFFRRARAAALLQKEKRDLTRYGQELALISGGSELIQAVQDESKLTSAVAKVFLDLFPGSRGYFGLVLPAEDTVEVCDTWGYSDSPDNFSPSCCLALQLGRWVSHDEKQVHASCAHFSNLQGNYLCMPLRSANGHLGVIHLETPEKIPAQSIESVALFAAQIALGLTNLRVRESLRVQSVRDALTGLFNRRYFDETLQREMVAARRESQCISVLMIDLDEFKRCNDTFGHAAGDDVLRGFAQLMRSTFRESDVLCRYGGEEFAVIMIGASLLEAHAKAEAFRRLVAVADLRTGAHGTVRLTASVGVASTLGFNSPSDVVAVADAALYQAKRNGRNCTWVHTEAAASEKATDTNRIDRAVRPLPGAHVVSTRITPPPPRSHEPEPN